MPTTLPLMPASDCPATWGTEGFLGMRTVPDSVWLRRFRENPAAFRWDDWRVPPSDIAPFVGDLSTYGAFSDFNRDILATYGAVTPKGDPNQLPRERGFPLGIEVRYDAFKFDRPSLRDGVFVRWLVVNNSAKVYGSGIDYDSLYMGIDPGYISTPGLTAYNVPALGLHIRTHSGWSGRCSNTYPRRMLPGVNEACGGGGNPNPDIIMMLKSPIGDLRNKLFSNPASPYYSPSHLTADDTITFNHWRKVVSANRTLIPGAGTIGRSLA